MRVIQVKPKLLSLKGASIVGVCKKCKGQLFLASDRYGKYISCLQCGYSHDLDSNNHNQI